MPQPNDLATTRSGTPSAGTRRPVDHRSRAQRWRDAVAELAALQKECDAWLQTFPGSPQQSATAEALQGDLRLGHCRSAGHRTTPRVRQRLSKVGESKHVVADAHGRIVILIRVVSTDMQDARDIGGDEKIWHHRRCQTKQWSASCFSR